MKDDTDTNTDTDTDVDTGQTDTQTKWKFGHGIDQTLLMILLDNSAISFVNSVPVI